MTSSSRRSFAQKDAFVPRSLDDLERYAAAIEKLIDFELRLLPVPELLISPVKDEYYYSFLGLSCAVMHNPLAFDLIAEDGQQIAVPERIMIADTDFLPQGKSYFVAKNMRPTLFCGLLAMRDFVFRTKQRTPDWEIIYDQPPQLLYGTTSYRMAQTATLLGMQICAYSGNSIEDTVDNLRELRRLYATEKTESTILDKTKVIVYGRLSVLSKYLWSETTNQLLARLAQRIERQDFKPSSAL